MIHDRRVHATAPATLDRLVELSVRTWCCCAGFTWETLTLLNDAFSEDGAQEYGVIRNGRQIDSVTCSWMKPAELRAYLIDVNANGTDVDLGPYTPPAVPHGDRCRLCA